MDRTSITNANPVLTFLCRTMCIENCEHVKKIYVKCKKGCSWICQWCGSNSKALKYAYYFQIGNPYCIIHCLSHKHIIHHCQYYGYNVTLYDIKSKLLSLFKTNQKTRDCDSISFHNRIFILGSYQASRDVFEIDIKTHEMKSKAPMLIAKRCYTLCIAQKHIYSIGGYDDSTWIANCEKYSIHLNKWKLLPNLQQTRHFCAAFSFNDKEIYALGGYGHIGTNGKSGSSNSMEKLIIRSPFHWEYISILNPFSPRYCIHVIQISKNNVLVFGGDETPTKGNIIKKIALY